MPTREQWLVRLRREQAAGRLTLDDLAHMLALRDERVETLDAVVRDLMPQRRAALPDSLPPRTPS